MHWTASVVISVLLLLPAIWHARQKGSVAVTQTASPGLKKQPDPAVSPASTGRIANPGLFAADHGSFALDVNGDMRVVGGTLDVTGDIRINGRSVGNLLWAIINQGRASCAGIPCVHGVHDFLRTCTCICEDGWSGQACDTFDCFGNGDWNTALQRCDCYPPFEASTQCEYQLCRGVMMHTCTALLESGCDIPGAFPADNCVDVCAAPRPCSARANWGRALLPSSDYMVGVCGGGFDGANGVTVGAMQCPPGVNTSQCISIFRAEAPVCCSPGSPCGGPSCSNAACCLQLTSRDSCLLLGCVWASGKVCMHASIARTSVDCELPVVPSTSGRWSRFSYGCTETSCPQTAVDRYVQIYTDACGEFYSNDSDCLSDAFDAVNSDAWPELLSSPIPPSSTFRLLLTNDSGLGQCKYGNGLSLSRLCKRPIKDSLVFTFVPAAASSPTQWQQSSASGYIIAVDSHGGIGGKVVCIASSGLSPFLAMQLFPDDSIYLPSIDDGICGIYVLPFADHFFRTESGDEMMLVDDTGVALWSSSNSSSITLSLLFSQ